MSDASFRERFLRNIRVRDKAAKAEADRLELERLRLLELEGPPWEDSPMTALFALPLLSTPSVGDDDPPIRYAAEMTGDMRRRALGEHLRAFPQALTSSYVLYKTGDIYYAYKSNTGKIPYSGTSLSTVIQNAIDDLNSDGGGTIFARTGDYNYSTSIAMKPNTSLVGEGVFRTKFIYSGTSGSAFTIEGASSAPEDRTYGIRLADFTIQGDNTPHSGVNGINVKYTTWEVVCERLRIWRMGDFGLALRGDTGMGIYRNLYFNENESGAIKLEATDTNPSNSNRFENIYMSGHTDDYVILIQDICLGNKFYGLHFENNAPNFALIKIKNSDSTEFIYCESMDDTIASGQQAVWLEGTTKYTTFIGGEFYHTLSGQNVFYIGDTAAHNTIAFTNIIGNSRFAVYNAGSGTNNLVMGLKRSGGVLLSGNFSAQSFNEDWDIHVEGKTTLTSGTTSKTVDLSGQILNVSGCPTSVIATPNDSLYSATLYYVNSLQSGSFTINVNADPNHDIPFGYRAYYRRTRIP